MPASPNPWREIWLHPRSTIRAILKHNYTEACEPLAMVMGVFWLFTALLEAAAGSPIALLFIWVAPLSFSTVGGSITTIFMTLVGGSFLGFFAVHWLASAIAWLGRSVGSEADKKRIYTTLTWSAVPLTSAIPLQILCLLLIAMAGSASDFITSAIIGLGVALLKVGVWILGLWHLGLAVAMVAEVARVRVWLAALWVVIFPCFLVTMAFWGMFLCFFIEMAMMSQGL